VQHVAFQDIAFRHSSEVRRTNTYQCFHTAVLLQQCEGVTFERVDIAFTGGNGIYMASGVRNVTIESSRVYQTGGEVSGL
jgi:hypothetical protein